MMLEASLADVSEQVLQLWYLDDARAAEGLQGIVGEVALADVAPHLAFAVISGEARIAHRRSLHTADAGAEGVLLTDGAGDDLLEVHADVLEEVLGQVAAVEADSLVRIAAVVVIPIEQCAWRLG